MNENDEIFDRIEEAIGRDGWCVFENFLPAEMIDRLAKECRHSASG